MGRRAPGLPGLLVVGASSGEIAQRRREHRCPLRAPGHGSLDWDSHSLLHDRKNPVRDTARTVSGAASVASKRLHAHLGAVHLTSAVAAVYSIAIGGLFWWTLAQAKIPLSVADISQLTLGFPLYALATILIPAMAWTLLLMVYISAYRVSGPSWIPGTVMILTTPFLGHWLGRLFVRVSYSLPGWHVLTDMQRVLDALGNSTTATFQAEGVVETAAIIPQEPVWIMLVLSIGMLILAGRIWQEVEG